MPLFSVDPARCDITYSTVISYPEAEPAYSFDDTTLEFDVFWDTDTSPAGIHRVILTGTSGEFSKKEASLDFFLSIVDPCYDPSFT